MRVLIPVNELDRAKGRLSEVLDPATRASLALATVGTVAEAVRAAGHEPVLLTRDKQVRASFEGAASLLDEDANVRGLNAQLESAIARLAATGGLDELLILHADLPLATAAAVREIIGGAPAPPSVTIVESPDGGTNAMLLRPPGRFALAYGRGSFALHRAAAEKAGMRVEVISAPALALDLDTPADVELLLALPEGRNSAAGKVLARARAGAGTGEQ